MFGEVGRAVSAADRGKQAVAIGQSFGPARRRHQQRGPEQIQQGQLVGFEGQRVDTLHDPCRRQLVPNMSPSGSAVSPSLPTTTDSTTGAERDRGRR